MTDRLQEIKERQEAGKQLSGLADWQVNAADDIAWLISELEKANAAAHKSYAWFYGAGTTEQERAMCDAWFKWNGGPYTGSETLEGCFCKDCR